MSAGNDNTRQQPDGPLAGGSPVLRRWVATSIALHACVLGALLIAVPPEFMPVVTPGDRNGHLIALTYSPGKSAPASTLETQRRLVAKPVPPRIATATTPTPVVPPIPPPSTVASASTDASIGADALGDGDTTLALVVVHPPPQPDLSQLPAGTRGDVIVDVVIDKTGRIAKFTMTRGLGHGVDETVIATIKQWTFQPATRNGVPVASEQELLFHYERG